MIHILAQELNNILKDTTVDYLLSDMGKRMFFPKGIIAQSAEAKQFGKKANATIGITVNDGLPVCLPAVQKHLPTLSRRYRSRRKGILHRHRRSHNQRPRRLQEPHREDVPTHRSGRKAGYQEHGSRDGNRNSFGEEVFQCGRTTQSGC